MTNEEYDLIIIGAGPAGLTAGLYAGRYKLNTLVLGSLPGGMITESYKMCNFPTYKEISGAEFTQKMMSQVSDLGVKISPENVNNIEKIQNNAKTEFKVETGSKVYSGKEIIIATGSDKNKLNIPGEKEFLGRGVSYCATCDAGFYKDKIVGVIGGGDAALSSALLIAEYAKKVYIIYRREEFRKANASWIEQVEKNDKIDFIFNAVPEEIYGTKDEGVKGIKLEDGRNIELDGVFAEIGSTPEKKISRMLGVETNDKGYIKTNKNQKTSVEGVYAAGDITDNPLKQVITAAGQGAVAAHVAYEEITKNN
ncbi:MAG TPA: FAD-dependent oxidoreductase [Candidatus Nanoarchaeia archaeon]|nr:FAD-dependent oxidoreductase [Candidatus Nanoarchaeia archaeon]